LRLVKKKAVTPSLAEIQKNPRSRSAKLRVAEHIVVQDEQYRNIERLCCSMEIKDNGWRRPTLLRKLRQAFSVA
jgi:hypothetical protein